VYVDANMFHGCGEGALLGATQERLSDLWRASLPPDEPPPDNPQLG
jgi:hypothetical protein